MAPYRAGSVCLLIIMYRQPLIRPAANEYAGASRYRLHMAAHSSVLGVVVLFVICLRLAFGDELPGHMQPLGSHRPMEGEIERINNIPDPVTFYEEYVVPKRPVVLAAAIANTPPLTRWTDEYFKCVWVWVCLYVWCLCVMGVCILQECCG